MENIFINDKFQWYDLASISKDTLKLIRDKKTGLFELYSQPIQNSEILKIFPKKINIKSKKKNQSYTVLNQKMDTLLIKK